MKTIGLIYGRFVARNRGNRPGDLAAFKKHADANCQRLLKVAQVTSADELLRQAEEIGELTMVFAGREITVDGLDEKQVVAIVIPDESNANNPEIALVVDSLGVVAHVNTIQLQGL